MAERPRGGSRAAVQIEVLRLLRRRRWLLAVPWIASIAIGVTMAVVTPSVYESSVVLSLRRLSSTESSTPAPGPGFQADFLREQTRSTPFLRSVIIATGIDLEPATRAWVLRSAPHDPGASRDEVVRAFLIDDLREAIAVSGGRDNEFTVTVSETDRARARTLAQGVADQLVRVTRSQQVQQAGRLQESNVEQLQDATRQLEAGEAKLAAFRRTVLAAGDGAPPVSSDAARAAQEKARIEADDLRKHADALRQQLAGRVGDQELKALTSRRASTMSAERTELERRLADAMLADSSTADPGAIRLSIVRKQAELGAELTQVAAKALPKVAPAIRDLAVYYRLAQADVAGVEARREVLTRRANALEHRASMTTDQQADFRRLNDDVARFRAVRDSLARLSASEQLAQAFASARLSGRFEVVQPARWPSHPVRPNRLAIILAAFLTGGVVGVGTVLVAERFDTSMKSAEEVGRLLELPLLGALPRVPELEGPRRGPFAGARGGASAAAEHGLLRGFKVDSPLALQFRRVYLELARDGRPLPRTLLVTSASRGEGKSTTVACLGMTLARERKEKVLMVDFDLRHPGLHGPLGLPGSSRGVTQMLAARRFEPRFVRATSLPFLDFLPAGKSDQPADELVEAGLVEWFVREASSRYAYVVLDCAPNLEVPDALLAGRAVDGVVFVVKAGATVRRAADNGVRLQREWRDNVIGVLINDAGGVLPPFHDLPSRAYSHGDMVGDAS